jgi:hypothetical protein
MVRFDGGHCSILETLIDVLHLMSKEGNTAVVGRVRKTYARNVSKAGHYAEMGFTHGAGNLIFNGFTSSAIIEFTEDAPPGLMTFRNTKGELVGEATLFPVEW